jgi:hypothetical protein
VPIPRQDLFHLPVLRFYIKKDIFVCLWELYREFHCDISMYMCIITRIRSSLLVFFILP